MTVLLSGLESSTLFVLSRQGKAGPCTLHVCSSQQLLCNVKDCWCYAIQAQNNHFISSLRQYIGHSVIFRINATALSAILTSDLIHLIVMHILIRFLGRDQNDLSSF